MSNVFRTDIETLLLSEMVEEDNVFIMNEDMIDGLIPENTKGIFDDSFGDTSSEYDDLDDLIAGDYELEIF